MPLRDRIEHDRSAAVQRERQDRRPNRGTSSRSPRPVSSVTAIEPSGAQSAYSTLSRICRGAAPRAAASPRGPRPQAAVDLRFATTARARLCSRRRRCRCWEDRASAIRDWPGRPQTSQAGGRPMRRRRQLSRRRPRSARRPGATAKRQGLKNRLRRDRAKPSTGRLRPGRRSPAGAQRPPPLLRPGAGRRGASAGAACCADADDRSSSAKATSRADWNRCCGCFSSARCTMRVRVGESDGPSRRARADRRARRPTSCRRSNPSETRAGRRPSRRAQRRS